MSYYRQAASFDCRTNGVSAGWIEPNGKIHILTGGQEHVEFAQEWLDDDWDDEASETLMEQGWIRVSNLRAWQWFRPPTAAKKAALNWMIHCAVQNKMDLERPNILLEHRPGDMDFFSPAEFVKRLGGYHAEDELFEKYHAKWPRLRAASYNYDRRVASRSVLALRQKTLLSLMTKGGTFGVISAFRPGSKSQNKGRHAELLRDLQVLGYSRWEDLKSRWEGVPEKSVLVPGIKPSHLFDLMRKYNQDAVVYKTRDGVIGLYYQAGYAEVAMGADSNSALSISDDPDLYSKIRSNWSFEFGFLWGERLPFNGREPITKKVLKSLEHI